MTASTQDPLRQELQDAIQKVRHQIEVQQMSDHYIGSGDITAEAILELKTELAQLEEALARLA